MLHYHSGQNCCLSIGVSKQDPKLVYPGDDCDNDQDPEGLDELMKV